MEPELRDALKDIRDSVKDTQSSLHAKLDISNQQFNSHLVDDARNFQRLEMKTDTLSAMMEDTRLLHRTRAGNRWLVWVALVGALATPFAVILIERLFGK